MTFQINQSDIEKRVQELALKTLLGNLPVALYWMDRNGYQLGCNDRELALLGLVCPTQFVGKHSTELSHFSAWENSQQVMETDQVMTMEERGRPGPDGECPYYLSIKSPIHDEKGEVIGMLGISLDITERKRNEALLEQAKQKAESANRAKTEFLSMVSHELRIPLSGVLGMARLLDLEYLLPAQHEQVQDIVDASDHLLALVDDLLDVAKLEAGKLELVLAPFNFKQMLEETITILNFQAKAKGIDLLLRYDENVPHIVLADARALRQILINLIGNALKFTHHGYILVSVECTTITSHSAQFIINVEDTGIGIPEDKLAIIFDRFQQAGDPTYQRRYGGTGLGLSISKGYTQLMGGNLTVSSKVGKGSRFTCTVPIRLPTESAMASPWAPYKKNVRILIVTDKKEGEWFNKNILGDHTQMVSGKKALQVLQTALKKKYPFDVVIMDHQLNNMDVAQLATLINRELGEHKPMQLLLFSDETKITKEALKTAGFFSTLVKTAQPVELLIGLTNAWEKWVKKLQLQPTSSLKEDGSKLKLLLVEDDKIVQKVHRMMLEKLGYEVEVVENGPQALQKTREADYDAIFMDVGLPGMSGLEATIEIRKHEKNKKHTPIIAMTAYVYEEDRRNCLAAGMDDVAIKPISFGELQKTLQKWLEPEHKDQSI